MDIQDIFNLINPIRKKVMMLVGRGVVSNVNNSGSVGRSSSSDDSNQRVQVEMLAGEVLENIERFQNYGFESRPFNGAQAIVVFIDGNRDNGIVIAVPDKRHRITDLGEGDTAQYDDAGARILCSDGKVALGNKTKPFTSTPTAATGLELVELLDRTLTLLQGVVTLPGDTTGTTFVPAVLTELALIQTDLNVIKGTL